MKHRPFKLRQVLACVLGALSVAALPLSTAWAAPAGSALPAAPAPPKPAASEHAWASLNVGQQQVLAPLKADWLLIDAPRRKKWIEIANRFPDLPKAQQERVQARMAEWARMTPQERGQARLQFMEAQALSKQDRREKWREYQLLPQEQRAALQDRAVRALAVAPSASAAAAAGPASSPMAGVARTHAQAQAGDGLVQRKVVGPMNVRAKPGATTNLVTAAPRPLAVEPEASGSRPGAGTKGAVIPLPAHVDRQTLLPKPAPAASSALGLGPGSAPRQP